MLQRYKMNLLSPTLSIPRNILSLSIWGYFKGQIFLNVIIGSTDNVLKRYLVIC